MATTEQKFLDYPGLEYYHQQNVALMDEKDNSVLTESKAYADTINEALAVERARIDTFTSLPEGATISEAELQDIKVKVDGTTADTAGNAVREQITTLDTKIDEEVVALETKIDEVNSSLSSEIANVNKGVFDVVNCELSFDKNPDNVLHFERNAIYKGTHLYNWSVATLPYDDVFFKLSVSNYIAVTLYVNDSIYNFLAIDISNGNLYLFSNNTYSKKTAISNFALLDLGRLEVVKNGNVITFKDDKNSFDVDVTTLDGYFGEMTPCIGVVSNSSYATDKPIYHVYTPIQFEGLKTAYGTNILDSEPLVYGSYYDVSNNGVVKSGDNYCRSGLIEIPKGKNSIVALNKAVVNGEIYANGSMCAFFNSNKEYLERAYMDYRPIGKECIIPIPNGASYVGFTFTVANLTDHYARFTTNTNKWDNTIGAFVGDSITAQKYMTDKFKELYNITILNYGVSGTCVASFTERVESMYDDVDFVFVLGGTNDWSLGTPIGTKTDTTNTTFYGALYELLSALRTKYPTKTIFVSTILQRNWTLDDTQPSGIWENKNGNSIIEFNEAIKYMANLFGCVVLDGFGESGIIVGNIRTYTNDGLHPNLVGGARLATYYKDKMEQFTPIN